MTQKLLSALCVITVLMSCSSTNRMSLGVPEPALVNLPLHIKNVGIVNRTAVDPKSRAVDITDKIFSLEGMNMDKAGSASAMKAISIELQRDKRFTGVQLLSDQLNTVNPAVFPTPLAWETVDQICRQNAADALLVLELFDTDSKLSYAAHPVKMNTPFGAVPGLEHEASMLTLVKTGWRLYDPADKIIIDEFASGQDIRYTGRGINPVVAANALINRPEAVKEVAARSGQFFAQRFLPSWQRVWRDYYVRGSNSFTVAKRMAQTGNWGRAAELWENETGNRRLKVAGRACYNMAIISEINSDLPGAIKWAQRAYEEYNNKLALRYVRILQSRQQRMAYAQ